MKQSQKINQNEWIKKFKMRCLSISACMQLSWRRDGIFFNTKSILAIFQEVTQLWIHNIWYRRRGNSCSRTMATITHKRKKYKGAKLRDVGGDAQSRRPKLERVAELLLSAMNRETRQKPHSMEFIIIIRSTANKITPLLATTNTNYYKFSFQVLSLNRITFL